jgi:hypothetical protein
LAHRFARDHLCDLADHLSGVLLERPDLATQHGLAGGIYLFDVADD